jgi:hypothetical protein
MEHLLEGCGSQDSESAQLRSPILDADFRCWHQTDVPVQSPQCPPLRNQRTWLGRGSKSENDPDGVKTPMANLRVERLSRLR